MTVYICNNCQTSFDDPETEEGGFVHAFGYCAEHRPICPQCGSADLAPARACPDCGGEMRPGDILCRPCRRRLRGRIKAFFGPFSPAALEQAERWLDGVPIGDCKNWEVDL